MAKIIVFNNDTNRMETYSGFQNNKIIEEKLTVSYITKVSTQNE